jgi:hypothetical protein
MMNDRASGAPETALARGRIGRLATVFLPAFILFALGAVTDIALPGVYMDAVNPDYFIVLLLNLHHAQISDWHLPGTLLFGLFPMIGQIYHGALPYYVGLPFYALFGTGVVGIRLTNMVFGLIVLAGAGAFMWAFRTRTLISALCLALLALDPGFLFSFRTQFYITLLPVAALLASAAVIEARGLAPTRGRALCGGLFAGIACYGYFIYGFLVPAVAVCALARFVRTADARRLILYWIGGFLLGVSPYAVGFLLIMIATGGPRGLVRFVWDNLHSLNTLGGTLPFIESVTFFVDTVRNTVLDVGPALMMLKQTVALQAPQLKMIVLLAFPVAAIVTGLARPWRVRGLLVLAGILLGFLVLVIVFGTRLWLHHAAFLPPVLYVALALALERFAAILGPRRRLLAGLVAAIVTVPFLIANAADRQAVFLHLEATRGVDLMSDAINRYAEDSLRNDPAAKRFFPDWGIFMSFAMITRGTVPYTVNFLPGEARAALCAGQDAELAAMARQPAQRLQDWIAAVGWPHYEKSQYLQGDGRPMLDIVRWHAVDRPAGACP